MIKIPESMKRLSETSAAKETKAGKQREAFDSRVRQSYAARQKTDIATPTVGKVRDDAQVRQSYAARQNTDIATPTVGPVRDDAQVRQSYAARNNETTSGGYYSQPEIGGTLTVLQSNAEKQRTILARQESAIQAAQAEVSAAEQETTEARKNLVALLKYSSDTGIVGNIFQGRKEKWKEAKSEYEKKQAEAQSVYDGYVSAYQSYSQAASAYQRAAEKATRDYDKWKSTIRDKDSVEAEIAEVEEQIRNFEKQQEEQNQKIAYGNLGYGYYTKTSEQKQADIEAEKSIQEAKDEVKALREKKALLEEELDWANFFGWEKNRDTEDFGKKSRYVSTANGKTRSATDIALGHYDTSSSGYDDPLYEYINGNQAAGSYIRQSVEEGAGSDGFARLLMGMTDTPTESQQMTEDEIAMFNYLYAKDTENGDDDHKNAYAYYNYLKSDALNSLNYRQRREQEARMADWASDNKWTAKVYTVATSPMKGIAYLNQVVDYAVNKKIDENAAYNRFSYESNAARNAIAQKIEERWGKGGSFTYQTFASMFDFLLNTAITGGFAGGGKFSEAMSLAIMGTGAAADATIEAKERGLSDGKAFWLGTVAGLAEVASEKFSIEALLKGKWENKTLKYILKNAFTEGAEEVASDMINLMADILIAKDQSKWREAINDYMAQGKTESEAFGLAFADQAAEMGLDFAGGFISGGVMAGMEAGKGAIQKSVMEQYAAPLGKQIKATDEALDAIIAEGLDTKKGSEIYDLAEQLRDQRQNGKESKDSDVGLLYWMLAEEGRTGNLPTDSEMLDKLTTQAEAAQSQTQAETNAQDAEPIQGIVAPSEDTQAAKPTLESTAQKYGVKQEIVDRVKRIQQVVNREILFYYDENERQNGKHVDGSGILWVNVRSKNPVAQIIGHELTHSIETWSEYGKFSETVLKKMQQQGYDLNAKRQQITDTYKRNGITLNDTASIDKELVAEYMERNLLTNEAAIREFVQTDRTMGQRIKDMVDRILAMLGKENAKERVWLQKVSTMYARALQEAPVRYDAEVNETPDLQEAGRDTGDYRAELEERYRSGEITEEEFDRLYDEFDNGGSEDLVEQTMRNVKYSIGRTRGMTLREQIRQLYNGGLKSSDSLYFGETPEELSDAGLDSLPLAFTQSDFRKSTKGKHNVPRRVINNLTNDLKNALFAFTDGNRVGIVTDDIDGDGKPLLVGIEKNVIMDAKRVNAIRSTYGLDNPREWLKNQIARKEFVLLDKERANTFLYPYGYSASRKEGICPLKESISQSNGNVNIKYSITAESDSRNPEILSDLRRYETGEMQGKERYSFVDALDEGSINLMTYIQQEAMKLTEEAYRNGYSVEQYVYRSNNRFYADGEMDEAAREAIRKERSRYSRLEQQQRYQSEQLDEDWENGRQQERERDTVPERRRSRRINEAEDTALQRDLPDSWTGSREYMQLEAQKIQIEALQNRMSTEEFVKQNREHYTDAEGNLTEAARMAIRNDENRKGMAARFRDQELEEYWKARNPEDADSTESTVDERLGMRDAWERAAPAEAAKYMKRAERTLSRKIADLLSVPSDAKSEFIDEAARQISGEYILYGKVSQETRRKIFEDAYKHGMELDEEYYNQYKEIKDHLRTTAVTLSERDRADIADFESFRKSAFGSLRIVNEGGLPVDTAYQELNSMAPEIFPERITHPADQLMKMLEVAKGIRKVKVSLDAYYGDHTKEFKAWAWNDFEQSVTEAVADIRQAHRYTNEALVKQDETARAEEQKPKTVEDMRKCYKQLKDARRELTKAKARNLLTDSDMMKVGKLLRGEMGLDSLDANTDNVRGIKQVYEAQAAYDRVNEQIREWNRKRKAGLRELADGYLETAGTWKDKKTGLQYMRETQERNIRDIVPDQRLAEQIDNEYFRPVHISQAEATRFKEAYRERVKKLGLSTKETKTMQKNGQVCEANAVQFLGEVRDNIRMLEANKDKMKTRDGKTLEEWRSIERELLSTNPKLDIAKIERAIEEFRKIYDELFEKMNEVRIRNGYEPINYRKGYFPHFQHGYEDGVMGVFGRAMGISTDVRALPTTINGLTHTFKPGIQWFGNALERKGFNTVYNAVEGFDKYIEGIADVIFQTDNIQKLRAFTDQVRYRTSDEGIRKQMDEIDARTETSDEEKRAAKSELAKNGAYKLSRYAVNLDEYTNLLANKKSSMDRNMENMFNRKMYNAAKWLESRVAANMVAVNPASWLTNFIPLTQGWGMVKTTNLLKGMWQTIVAEKTGDDIGELSTFLTNRRGSDPLVRTWSQKTSATLSKPMEIIDQFVAGSLVRARYYQNMQQKNNGTRMSAESALQEADSWAAGVMADRSKGSMPTLFHSNNPVTKIFTQFQLEVNNQLGYYFKDVPKGLKEKGLAALAWGIIKIVLGGFLYNELYERLIGRRPATDPVGILLDTGKDIFVDHNNAWDVIKGLTKNVAEEVPFVGGLIGGGRLPIGSARPDVDNLGKAIFNSEWSGKKRLTVIAKEILGKTATYTLLPFGGGQLKKIYQGLNAVIRGGSYTVDSDGNDILQYPVYKDSPWETAYQTGQVLLFGKTALKTAQDWVEDDFKNFSAKETAAYQAMTETGVSGRDAYQLLTEMKAVKKTDDESADMQKRHILQYSHISGDGKSVVYYGMLATDRERDVMDVLMEQGNMGAVTDTLIGIRQAEDSAEKRQYLRDSFLSGECKSIVYYGILASDKDREVLDRMAEMNSDMGTVTDILMRHKDADQLEGVEKSNQKRLILAESRLSDREKEEMYRYLFGQKDDDGNYTTSRDDDLAECKKVGMNIDDFLIVQNQYSETNEKYSGAGNKATEFSRWLNRQSFTEEQKQVIKECFKYYSQIPAEAGRYDAFVAAGLKDDDAYRLTQKISELVPQEGKTSVTSLQRQRAVIDCGFSTDDDFRALRALIPSSEEKTYQKFVVANYYSILPDVMITAKERLQEYDADGNGSYSNEEVKNAIDSMNLMNGNYAYYFNLSNDQKAVIWQLISGRISAKNNPYSSEVGQEALNALAEAMEKAREESDG